MGKTTLALNIAEYAAQYGEVLFVSLEMSDDQLDRKTDQQTGQDQLSDGAE